MAKIDYIFESFCCNYLYGKVKGFDSIDDFITFATKCNYDLGKITEVYMRYQPALPNSDTPSGYYETNKGKGASKYYKAELITVSI